MVEKICGKGEFWAWNETVNVWQRVRVVITEQAGGEFVSVTSSAGCFVQCWRNETGSSRDEVMHSEMSAWWFFYWSGWLREGDNRWGDNRDQAVQISRLSSGKRKKFILLFIIKIVHVVQNNEKKYTRQSKIKETCNKSKHTSISSKKINNVT